MKWLRKIFKQWVPADHLPQWQTENPKFSYDLLLSDGKQTFQGYYSFQGEIYFAYEHCIILPVKKWRFLTEKEVKRG